MATAPTAAWKSMAIGMRTGATAKRSIIVTNGPAESNRTLKRTSCIAAHQPSWRAGPSCSLHSRSSGLTLAWSCFAEWEDWRDEGIFDLAAPVLHGSNRGGWAGSFADGRIGRRDDGYQRHDDREIWARFELLDRSPGPMEWDPRPL